MRELRQISSLPQITFIQMGDRALRPSQPSTHLTRVRYSHRNAGQVISSKSVMLRRLGSTQLEIRSLEAPDIAASDAAAPGPI